MTGDSNREIWERVGHLDGRVSAIEQGQARIERQLTAITESLRALQQRLDRGAGFWSAVVLIGSVVGSIVGGAVWAMAEVEVGPFNEVEERVKEQVDDR